MNEHGMKMEDSLESCLLERERAEAVALRQQLREMGLRADQLLATEAAMREELGGKDVAVCQL